MSDDEKESSYNGGTLAGAAVGTAAGVALISNPAGVLGMLGVAAKAPVEAAGGFMTTLAAEAATAAAPVALTLSAGTIAAFAVGAVALIVAGALVGGMIVHAMHKSVKADTPAPAAPARAPSAPTVAQAPDLAPSKNWAKTVTAETEKPQSTGLGA